MEAKGKHGKLRFQPLWALKMGCLVKKQVLQPIMDKEQEQPALIVVLKVILAMINQKEFFV